jgi:hypothetical protein
MSSFQLNLSSLTLGAKERLACIEASAGGALRARLLSPSASGAPASAAGISAVSFSSALGGGVAGAAVSVPDGDHGVSGEFLLSGGVAGGLPAFVMTPDLIAKLCCGAVAGGVKFCTLNSSTCTFTSHAVKKVSVTKGDIYISTGRNSAFSNHHAPASTLSEADLFCRSF